jgi:quinoprotein dehydrogenase-associated probable ABC transporter substrate-binding protein
MCFVFRSAILFLGLLACAAQARELRVCADPDNLPLSHADGSGFENRIARLVAEEMGAELSYEWLPSRSRGYVRKTMGAGLCDVFIGVPKEFERVLTTRPYYRSTFVVVTGREAGTLSGLDDPKLKDLRIGVQLVGNDLAATPPGHMLAMLGHVENVRGFTVWGEGPAQERLVAATARGELDAAIVWGPEAGWLVRRSGNALAMQPAKPLAGHPELPFEFEIAMGVKRGNKALRDELDAILDKRRADVDAILAEYAVPRTDR